MKRIASRRSHRAVAAVAAPPGLGDWERAHCEHSTSAAFPPRVVGKWSAVRVARLLGAAAISAETYPAAQASAS
jgi:hypothetical protein